MPPIRSKTTAIGIARHFEELAATHNAKLTTIAGTTLRVAEKKAKALFGNEERLIPLKDSTLREKARLNFPTPYPLIRTGELLESVRIEMEESPGLVLGAVGSDLMKMVWHERGDGHMPARPVLAMGAIDALPVVAAIVRVGMMTLARNNPDLPRLFSILAMLENAVGK
jgi:hypothetical protein